MYFIHTSDIQSNNKEFENMKLTSIPILKPINYPYTQLIKRILAQLAKFKETDNL